MRGLLVCLLFLMVGTTSLAARDDTPAKLREAALPALSLLTAQGGRVELAVEVSESGEVVGITELASTPPFTDLARGAVAAWKFRPARSTEDGVTPSAVLVAAIFRAPVLTGPGPMASSDRPRGQALPTIPRPLSIVTPPFPPLALHDGIVLVEVEIDEEGSVQQARVFRSSSPGFEEVSLDAARRWHFRAARREGRLAPSVAYLLFGFRQPVTDPIDAIRDMNRRPAPPPP